MAVTNRELRDELANLAKGFGDFVDQYNADMRGDTKLGNGEKGVIGELREIKDYQKKYPSLLYLFAHRPIPTVSVVLGIYSLLMVLWTLGIIKLFGQLVGLDVPQLPATP